MHLNSNSCIGMKGPKLQLLNKPEFDPVTRKPYASNADAQSVALGIEDFTADSSQGHADGSSQGHIKQAGMQAPPVLGAIPQ